MRIAVLAVSLLLVALAGGTVWGVRYVGNSQRFCGAACHAETATPRHPGVDCYRCHSAAPASRFELFRAAIFRRKSGVPPHGKAKGEPCASCHKDAPDSKWNAVAATVGHKAHLGGATPTPCAGCHGAGEHQASGVGRVCVGCHKKIGVHTKPVEGAEGTESCVACHAFSLKSPEKLAAAAMEACGRCHAEGKNVTGAKAVMRPKLLHAQVDCNACHSPHKEKAAGANCAKCHEKVKPGGSERVQKGHSDCDGCHEPHKPTSSAKKACEGCHDQFFAAPKPGAPAITASKHEACIVCHEPHVWTANPAICADCHDKRAEEVTANSPAGHTCVGCHNPMQPLPGPAACIKCHPQRASHAANAPAGHQRCIGCHNQHGVKKGVFCPKCHTAENQQISAGGAGHKTAGCRTCHTPHDNPLPPISHCATCHAPKVSAVSSAGPAPHKRCASCHQPHQFRIASSIAACGRCHGTIAASPGPHKGECKSCHTPHGPPAITTQACQSCHSDKFAGLAGNKAGHHTKCNTCHKPHTMKTGAATQCQSCHADKAAIAKSWPPGSPHQADCSQCHKPHSGKGPAECGTCHSSEAAELAAGPAKHRCVNCHYPHQTPLLGGGWWARCAGCHTAQKAGADTRGPTHRNCANCHKKHSFNKPACTSCHTNQKTAAHAVPGHANCLNCHGAHVLGSTITRSVCEKCHKDKTQHQPSAQRCQACHPFQ